jgi:predicted DNA-binding transcriptional regulator AlpA
MTYNDQISHMKKTMPQRAVIYIKDVENIIGKSEKTARRLLQKVRKQTGKTNEQFITVEEFCQVTGIPESVVRSFLVY